MTTLPVVSAKISIRHPILLEGIETMSPPSVPEWPVTICMKRRSLVRTIEAEIVSSSFNWIRKSFFKEEYRDFCSGVRSHLRLV